MERAWAEISEIPHHVKHTSKELENDGRGGGGGGMLLAFCNPRM
jgi:hypothetical protein